MSVLTCLWVALLLLFNRRLKMAVGERTRELSVLNEQLQQEVAERRRAEHDLRVALTRVESIIEHTPMVAIESVDRDGNVLSMNSMCTTLFGYSAEEAMGAPLGRLLFSEDSRLEGFGEGLKRTWDTGEASPPCEWEVVTRTGDTKRVLSVMFPIFDEETVTEVFCMSVDLTEQKRVEEALRASEAHYRAIVGDLPFLLCRLLPDGTLTFVNRAYAEYWGSSAEELIGTNCFSLIPEGDHEALRAHLASFVPEEHVKRITHQVITPSGEVRWQEWTDRAFFDDQDQVIEFQSGGLDVTERIYAERALRESEEQYRMIFDHSPLGIMHFDENGIVVDCNDRFAETLGTISDELLGLNMLTTVEDERVLDAIRRSLNGEIVHFEGEYRSVTTGKTTPFEATFGRIVAEDGSFLGAVCIAQDVTERKRAEEERKALESQMQHAQKLESLGVLAGGIAHDFNNLLMGFLATRIWRCWTSRRRVPPESTWRKSRRPRAGPRICAGRCWPIPGRAVS